MYLNRKIEVTVDRDTAYQYILDFSNIFEWDPAVSQAKRIDLGPIELGSKFQLDYRIMGFQKILVYTLKEKVECEKLVFHCQNNSFDSLDTITFKSQNQGCVITYEAEITLKNSRLESLLKPFMERIGNGVAKKLKEVLEGSKSILTKKAPLTLFGIAPKFSCLGWNKHRKTFTATLSHKKTVLITGPTSGLGRSLTFRLAGKGCDLILVGRNEEKLQALVLELKEKGYQGHIYFYACDMSQTENVYKCCEKILKNHDYLDVLVNNAGALFGESKTLEGIERTTLVDLVSPYLMSHYLLPLLKKTSGSVINVASGGLYGVPFNLEALKNSPEPFSGAKAYAYAKRAMLLSTQKLSEIYKDLGIRFHVTHPGWANTPGVESSLPFFHKITKLILRTTFQGADTLVWLIMKNPKQSGGFWFDRRLQPEHIFEKTKKMDAKIDDLMSFLKSFERPYK